MDTKVTKYYANREFKVTDPSSPLDALVTVNKGDVIEVVGKVATVGDNKFSSSTLKSIISSGWVSSTESFDDAKPLNVVRNVADTKVKTTRLGSGVQRGDPTRVVQEDNKVHTVANRDLTSGLSTRNEVYQTVGRVSTPAFIRSDMKDVNKQINEINSRATGIAIIDNSGFGDPKSEVKVVGSVTKSESKQPQLSLLPPKLRVAKFVMPEFPDDWDFSGTVSDRISRWLSCNDTDTKLAAYCAETKDFRNAADEHDPSLFG